MKKVLALLLVVIVAAVAFLYFPRGGTAEAADNAVLSVLNSAVEGQHGEAAFVAALDGEVFATGDMVRSSENGRGVLTFFDGSTLSIEPGSQVEVVALARVGDGGIQVTITQTLGRTWASIEGLKTPDSRFEIKTPSLTAVIRGTTVETIVELLPDGTTKTTVKTGEGEVLVTADAGGEVVVTAGTQASVGKGEQAPPQAEPQPPTPTLRFSTPDPLSFLVVDPRGLRCGITEGVKQRQIPGCDVLTGSQEVVIGDVVSGVYSVAVLAENLMTGGLSVQGSFGERVDFSSSLSREFRPSLDANDPAFARELVRTTLPVEVSGDTLSSPGFTPFELISSACGAEVSGTVYSMDNIGGIEPGQQAALVIAAADLTAQAQQGVGGGLPVEASNITVGIDPAGVHILGNASAGPITVALGADVIGGAVDGKLQLRLRKIEAGILPDAAKQQIASAIESGLKEFSDEIPLIVERVAFRPGCLAIIGRAP